MAAHRLFRKDMPGRQGEGVAQYVRKQQDCMELCLEQTTSQLRGQDYRADEYRRCGGGYLLWSVWSRSSHFQTTGRRNLTFTCPGPYEKLEPPQYLLKSNTAEHKQLRRFLECINNSSLIQGTEDPTHRSALLDLILANKEDQVRKENVWDSEQQSVCLKHKPAQN